MWNRGTTLGEISGHQIHQRTQIRVVMRLLGLKVPGFYGSAREEWNSF